MVSNPAAEQVAHVHQNEEVHSVQWKPLMSLTLLYASVIIGWIAYYNYQPKLLDKYNFKDLTLFLFIVQGIIMVITPMIAGRIGDRYRERQGKRLPLISAGISFAAMIFMSTAFTLFMDPGDVFRWILPVLITLWLFSMALFTSPAISTIELFVPLDKLPTAMAMLTIVYGLIYSIEPVIVDIIDYIGAPLTFVVGGVAVGLSGLLMHNNTKIVADKPKKTELAKSDFTYSLFLGIGFGIITTILFNMFPAWFADKGYTPFDLSGDAIVSIILALVAVISLPLSKFAESRSIYLAILLSILATFALVAGIFFAEGTVLITILLVLFAFMYSLMSVTFLPLALSVVKDKQKVFGVGVFFAGFELPNGILEAVLVALGKF